MMSKLNMGFSSGDVERGSSELDDRWHKGHRHGPKTKKVQIQEQIGNGDVYNHEDPELTYKANAPAESDSSSVNDKSQQPPVDWVEEEPRREDAAAKRESSQHSILPASQEHEDTTNYEYKNWHTSCMIAFVAISTILLNLPYFMGNSLRLEGSPLSKVLETSYSFQICTAIGFGISIPLMCNQLTSSWQSRFFSLRLIIVAIFSVCNIWVTFRLSFENSVTLFALLRISSFYLIGASVLTILFDLQKHIFSVAAVWTLQIIFLLGHILQVVYIDEDNSPGVDVFQSIILSTIFMLYLGFCYAINHNLYLEYSSSKDTFQNWYKNKLKTNDLLAFSLSWILLLYTALFTTANILYDGYSGPRNATPELLIATTAARAAFFILLDLIPGRILDFEILTIKVELYNQRYFIRYFSDEMRTPLSVLSIGIDLLESLQTNNPNVSPAAVSIVKDLKSACKKGLRVLDSLITYDKVGSSMIQFNRKPELLIPLLVETASTFKMVATAAGVTLSILATEDTSAFNPYHVLVDKDKFSQAVGNLIYNGIKQAPKGLVTIVMSPVYNAAPFKRIEKIRVEIRDNGAGFDPAIQSQIFNEVFNFNANPGPMGVHRNLGLWITKKYIEMNGGTIGMTSEGKGCGSTFFVEFPALLDEVEKTDVHLRRSSLLSSLLSNYYRAPPARVVPVEEDRDSERVSLRRAPQPVIVIHESHNPLDDHSFDDLELESHTSDRFGSFFPSEIFVEQGGGSEKRLVLNTRSQCQLNVLIVDDSSQTRKMLVRLMTSLGYTCAEADDGSTGVAMYKESRNSLQFFDLILMDNKMLVMNGIEATAQIRSLGYTGIIVGVTGNVEDIEEFVKKGCDKVLLKPLDVQKFTQAMREINEKRRHEIVGLTRKPFSPA